MPETRSHSASAAASDGWHDSASEVAALRAQMAEMEEAMATMTLASPASRGTLPNSTNSSVIPVDARAHTESWARVMRCARPEPFTGDRTRVRAFCREISALLTDYNQADTREGLVFATRHLSGDARVWYEFIVEYQPVQSWTQLEPKLLAEFQSVTADFDARLAFETTTQTGTLEDYNTAFRRVLAKLPLLDEAHKVFRYRLGLCADMRSRLAHEDFSSVLAFMHRASVIASRLPQEFMSPHPALAAMPATSLANVECHHCHQRGHVRRVCPYRNMNLAPRGRSDSRRPRNGSPAPRASGRKVQFDVPVAPYAGAHAVEAAVPPPPGFDDDHRSAVDHSDHESENDRA